MIKRRYFFSVKIAHDNNTGKYSWWNGVLTNVSLFAEKEELLIELRNMAIDKLDNEVERELESGDVQVIALNRI